MGCSFHLSQSYTKKSSWYIPSTVQGRLTWPEIQYNFVPEFFGRPKETNQLALRRSIVGTTAIVSTLLTVVGHPNTPILAGKGGLSLGLPDLPSKLSIKEVSSPHI